MNKIEGDLLVTGNLKAGSFVPPSASVGNDAINPNDPVNAAKLEHQHVIVYRLGEVTTAASAKHEIVHVAYAPGTMQSIRGGVVTPCVGNATITVDLKKNGTTILSSTVALSSAHAAYDQIPGTFQTADYAEGDVFSVQVTVSVGTGTLGLGLFVHIVTREGADG